MKRKHTIAPKEANRTVELNQRLCIKSYQSIFNFNFSLSSPSLKESKWSNPLIGANISWTKELVSDLRKRFDEAETFLPYCGAVSKLMRGPCETHYRHSYTTGIVFIVIVFFFISNLIQYVTVSLPPP